VIKLKNSNASHKICLSLALLSLLFAACFIAAGCGGGGDGSVASSYVANSSPVVKNLKIGETSESILVSFEAFDAESDACFAKMYYSTDRGVTYLEIKDASGLQNAIASGSTAVVLWKPVDFSSINLKDLKIKVVLNDSLKSEAFGETDIFSIQVPVNKAVGKIVFLSTRSVSQRIFIMNADGTNQFGLTDGKIGENFPAISYDGSKIVFVASKNSANDLYIMDSNGLNQKQLTFSTDGAEYYYPSFSKDGRKIVFIKYLNGFFAVCSINSDGSGYEQIKVLDYEGLFPVYSPDGSRIAICVKQNGKYQLSLINVSSKSLDTLISGGFDVKYPRFSPDGSKIIFVSNSDGDNEIYALELSGYTLKKITENVYDEGFPTYTADGASIIFNSRMSGDNQIYSMSADGSGLKRLTNTLNHEFMATAGEGFVMFASSKPLLKSIVLSSVSVTASKIDLSKVQCNAFYDDNTSLNVTPSWSIVSGGGSITGSIFEAGSSSGTDTVILRASYTESGISKTSDLKIKISGVLNNSRKIYLAAGSNPEVESNIYSVSPDGSSLTQLTFNNSTFLYKSAVSPDGKKLAYSGTVDGNVEIFVMDLATYEKKRLTTNSSYDNEPCFTPDSSKIIFSSNRDGNFELYLMDADGANQTRLTSNSYDDKSPCFSKNGTVLTYCSNIDGVDSIYLANINTEYYQISNETVVTENENGRSPCFISSSSIAFESDRDGVSKIYSLDLISGEVSVLTDGSCNAIQPSSLPEENLIVYVAESSGKYGIYILNVSTGEKMALVELGSLPANYGLQYPSLTSDKKYIVYGALRTHILSASLEDFQTYSLVRALNKSAAPFSLPEASSVLFHSDIDNIGFFDFKTASASAVYDIYSTGAYGGAHKKITSAAGDIKGFFNPSRAKSSSLITATVNNNSNSEIYVFDESGANLKNLTNNPAFDFLSKFSPDGSKIVFVSDRDNNYEIYIMNFNGSEFKNLTNNPSVDSEPNFSPDGSRITFSSNRDGIGRIYTMNVDGSDVKKITTSELSCFDPCYSPDGSKIVFCGYSSAISNGGVFIIDADGANQTMIIKNTPALMFISPSWN